MPTKVRLVKAMVFPVVMYGCESWTRKTAERHRMMLLNCGVREDSWESLGLQGDPTSLPRRRPVLSVHWKDWCWSWTPILWPPHAKIWLIGKDPDAGRDWGQKEKGLTEDEMAGWHHWLNGCESGWTPGVGDGQGGLECCDSWGCKESDMTEWLNRTELNWTEALKSASLSLSNVSVRLFVLSRKFTF